MSTAPTESTIFTDQDAAIDGNGAAPQNARRRKRDALNDISNRDQLQSTKIQKTAGSRRSTRTSARLAEKEPAQRVTAITETVEVFEDVETGASSASASQSSAKPAASDSHVAQANSGPAEADENSIDPKPTSYVESPCPMDSDPVVLDAPAQDLAMDIDAPVKRNPIFYVSHVADVFKYFRSLETRYHVNRRYMNEIQTDVNPSMRSILVDWLIEVAEEYRLSSETLFICVSLIDRCLSKFPVSRSKLQLLGCGCMLLAAKYEEIFAPAVDEFVYISDNTYTREEILAMESKVLRHLDFRLTSATAKHFLRRFTRAAQANERERYLTNYLSELVLLDYDYLKYTASVKAAAALLCARMVLGVTDAWNATLRKYTGYTARELEPCCRAISASHRAAPAASLAAAREKFSHPTLLRVATLPALSSHAWEETWRLALSRESMSLEAQATASASTAGEA